MKTCYLIFLLFFASISGGVDCYGQGDSNTLDIITITGMIVDENHEPILNAQVMLEDGNNTLNGTLTDLDGKFVMKIPANIANKTSAKINVKYIGRLPESKKLKELLNSGNILFVMRPDPEPLKDHHIGRYRVPLIDNFSGGNSKTIEAYEIEQGAY
jgi:hypothetical protein